MGTLVRGHHAGIVVPPGDSHALAEAMLAIEHIGERGLCHWYSLIEPVV
jgi:hypothetical protein